MEAHRGTLCNAIPFAPKEQICQTPVYYRLMGIDVGSNDGISRQYWRLGNVQWFNGDGTSSSPYFTINNDGQTLVQGTSARIDVLSTGASGGNNSGLRIQY